PPVGLALDADEVEAWIEAGLRDAAADGVRGGAVTPYLLGFVARVSGGRTLRANIGLIVNNARTGGLVASALT
ncbi:MAG: pseudouridine-5'-phosphate glycosidase, partial [Candidatus Limnocylindria bacterium]